MIPTPTERRAKRMRTAASWLFALGLAAAPVTALCLIEAEPDPAPAPLLAFEPELHSASTAMHTDETPPPTPIRLEEQTAADGRRVYRVRLTEGGDDLLIDATSGRVLRLIDARTGETLLDRIAGGGHG